MSATPSKDASATSKGSRKRPVAADDDQKPAGKRPVSRALNEDKKEGNADPKPMEIARPADADAWVQIEVGEDKIAKSFPTEATAVKERSTRHADPFIGFDVCVMEEAFAPSYTVGEGKVGWRGAVQDVTRVGRPPTEHMRRNRLARGKACSKVPPA